MPITKLKVGGLRNLHECEFNPLPGINLILGPNASGKTSLLEAIYILGRGESFRDRHLRNLINYQSEYFSIHAQKSSKQSNDSIGIQYSPKGLAAKINGLHIQKRSELAEKTAVQVITPNSHEIVEKGSSSRRRLIDWGVFHVEQSYRYNSVRYSKALMQRNAALKQNIGEDLIWIPELEKSAELITDTRLNYFKVLKEAYERRCTNLEINNYPMIEFYIGWNSSETLSKELEKNSHNDRKRGFTNIGPHRADILFRDHGRDLKRWGSRGQIKLILLALLLAQKDTIEKMVQKEVILLLDDLSAELDERNEQKVLRNLQQEEMQVFITSTGTEKDKEYQPAAVFHVEHGSIR